MEEGRKDDESIGSNKCGECTKVDYEISDGYMKLIIEKSIIPDESWEYGQFSPNGHTPSIICGQGVSL